MTTTHTKFQLRFYNTNKSMNINHIRMGAYKIEGEGNGRGIEDKRE